jgi:hypothetical protein
MTHSKVGRTGFIIDRTEARELFNEVRAPNEDEIALVAAVAHFVKEGQENDENDRAPVIRYISSRFWRELADRIKPKVEASNGKDTGTNRAGTKQGGKDDERVAGDGEPQSTEPTHRAKENRVSRIKNG